MTREYMNDEYTSKEYEHNNLCVGIDLGTTNSVIATINTKPNGDIVSKVVEIPRAIDSYNVMGGGVKLSSAKGTTLPSCIYYQEEKNYEPIVGDFAKNQYHLRTHLVSKSVKSKMGNEFVEGLSDGIPDKTPAEVASRTLQHLIKATSKIYKTNITDAVITVPANFDSVMCRATRDAAELAGIKVKNEDGSDRPVLLSEPNAVVYDLINQIRNGEIADCILDLNEKRNVMVFDIGGGTLDITVHEIEQRKSLENTVKVNEIATNRYTLLGGDDFDEYIAMAMYDRYCQKASSYPEILQKIKKDKEKIMPIFRIYAENLKIELNNEKSNDSAEDSWWDDEDEKIFNVGGAVGSVGFSYDDEFTDEEIEEILEPLMGYDFDIEDYKRLDKISNTKNIIYPVLDVLKKVSEKFETDEFEIDAVILNGGMSKFYMVKDRIEKFFGFEPIIALDPDLAVARGAAVYHHYLHLDEELKEYMRVVDGDESILKIKERIESNRKKDIEKPVLTHRELPRRLVKPKLGIEWGNSILNDSLYLGIKNGAVHEIIPTGAELPYKSEIMTGFKLQPDQDRIAIPIKSRNLNGTYRTIANGNIKFKNSYPEGSYVAFTVYMDTSKVITMEAWTSLDVEGMERIESGIVEIEIGNKDNIKQDKRTKITAPTGAILDPVSEINNLIQLCNNWEKYGTGADKSRLSKRIKSTVSTIVSAGNKDDFAPVILDAFDRTTGFEIRHRLFIIARKMGKDWPQLYKNKLLRKCKAELSGVLHGMPIRGSRVSINIQAIYALSICAAPEDMEYFVPIYRDIKYTQAMIYAAAKARGGLEYVNDIFERDAENVLAGRTSNIQTSAHAVGVAYMKDMQYDVDIVEEERIVKLLCKVIESKKVNKHELICSMIALGCICDQRKYRSKLSKKVVNKAYETIDLVECIYSPIVVMETNKVRNMVIKMINGEMLSESEEAFLLTKLEVE